MRVEVNLGKNKSYAGIVLEIHDRKPESFQIKPIRNLIDDTPVVQDWQLDFWTWVAQYYLCSLGDVMNAALPAYFKLMSESLLHWNQDIAEPPLDLSDDAFLIAEALLLRKQLTLQEVSLLLEHKNHARAVNELLELHIAFLTEVLEEKYKPKTEKLISLHPALTDELKLEQAFKTLEKAPKQLALLMQVMQSATGYINHQELLKLTKTSPSSLQGLLDKDILVQKEVNVDRLRYSHTSAQKEFALSEEQSVALHAIKEDQKIHQVTLLKGVTGSGKTMLYIQLIQEAINSGKQALYLLPEIALTTQVVSRLKAYFGAELGVYHSRFSNNERIETWNKVKDGSYKVILGPRSALWLPFRELGFIVVDEEHEGSYKQYEPAPRFHARDAAIYLATLHQAKVLLGSATPSIESSQNTQSGKYGYVGLDNRYMGWAMPDIAIVAAKNIQPALSPLLTVPLLESIQYTLNKGRQVILFQNKRGYAPFLICSSCGWVPHCKYCDVSLTYHKATDKLHCHYCGNKTPSLQYCVQCHSKVTARNFGTEKIEEELQRIFPKLKTARMDGDSMQGKNKMSQLLEDFSKGSIDILVGTQMVVKGLDFDNVGLVGIISADSLLSHPDFRVNERAFQLMEQVSGRAGRSDGVGKVVIQSHKLDHPVLQWVKDHDYRAFYQAELQARQHFNYPPFTRLIKLTCKHRNDKTNGLAAMLLSSLLEAIPGVEVKGPAPALVPRIRNYYLQEVWIKIAKNTTSLATIKEAIRQVIQKVLQTRGNSALQIVPDVDPM